VPPPELLETNVPGVFAAAMWAADRSSGWRLRSVKERWLPHLRLVHEHLAQVR
jgi:hypothetical protein